MKETIKIAVVGDIMPSGVLYGSEKDSVQSEVIQDLKQADIRIGNLECALGPYCDAPHFDPGKMTRLKDIVWAIDEDLEKVTKMGFNILCLANNHIFDLDKDGLLHTIKQLKEKGIDYCGAGMNIKEASKPAVINIKGKTIAVLSFCDFREETVGYVPFATEKEPGVNPLYPMEYSCAEIKKYKSLYDYVLVVPHWGVEHTWEATDTVISDSKLLIKAGADAIIGGHPHRIQSTFYYKGAPIFPSLGNFFFPDRWLNKPRPTWYPPKGTDTSSYPRLTGYPWVEEPTVKVWPLFERIGMIGHIEIDGKCLKKKVSFVCLTEENILQKINKISSVLPARVVLRLRLLKLKYKYPFFNSLLHMIRKMRSHFGILKDKVYHAVIKSARNSGFLRSFLIAIAMPLLKNKGGVNSEFVRTFKYYYPSYGNLSVKEVYKDYLSCMLKYSISSKDYFAYDWLNRSDIARMDYITNRRNDELYLKYDDQSLCPIMADKVKFNTHYKEFIRRDWLFLDTLATKDVFASFCQKHGRIIVKPKDGQRGDGVRIIEVRTEESIDMAWNEWGNKQMLVEEILIQGDLAKFHPQSVNTIRISTAIDKEGKPHIMASSIRFGRGENYVDNAHSGGVFCGIDVESGMIISPGIDKDNTHYLYHPDTQIPFLGFIIPKWNELKETAEKAASILPGLRYIGWDWVLCKDGHWELLEGNEPGNPDVLQLGLGRGLYSKYKSILQ